MTGYVKSNRKFGENQWAPLSVPASSISVLIILGLLTGGYVIVTNDRNCCALKVVTNRMPYHINDTYLSFALDTSFINTMMKKFSERDWDLVANMTQILSPAYLRLGGNDADNIVFDEIEHSHITPDDFLKIFKFIKKANLTLIFDLNVLLRKNGQWDSANAKKILNFFQKHDVKSGFQLGNEPNSFPHRFNISISGEQLGKDFVSLRSLLSSFSVFKSALLVGPDVTNPVRRYGSPSVPYLEDFLSTSVPVLNAVTWHQYYLNGRDSTLAEFLDPEVMNQLSLQITEITNVVRRHSAHLPIWLGETGSAYGGGAPNLSNTFASTFLFLDKLGLAATMGIGTVIRQSLLAGNYALIDKDLVPAPDFWVSLFYKKLVGNLVFNVINSDNDNSIRLYAHSVKDLVPCSYDTKREPSVVLYGMNLGRTFYHFRVNEFIVCSEFYLTSEDGDLQSKVVLVNGMKLEWPVEDIISLSNPAPSSDLTLKPHSLAFIVLSRI